MELETVIGLETHVQLKTNTKLFCACKNEGDNAPPNTNICPICLAHPGTLPVANIEALKLAVKTALMLDCAINTISRFDRKNYFYPDLPKAYQISQFALPIGQEGKVEFFTGGELKKVSIERLHLEEDAAKLLHTADGKDSLIDFNRAGTPLMEIVTKPNFRSPTEAKSYLQELRLIMRHLGVSDADMEKGNLRCDANISLRPVGETKLYSKTEIKNLNSFKSVERALAYEIDRQTSLWKEGKPVSVLTTRGWNENKGETYLQREKEESHDYRYFPEPDLPPITFEETPHEHGHTCKAIPANEINLSCLRSELPEKPAFKVKRFMEEYRFSIADAKTIVENERLSNYTEQVMSELLAIEESEEGLDIEEEELKEKVGKLVGGWITTELIKIERAHEKGSLQDVIKARSFAELLNLIIMRRVNSTHAKELLTKLIGSNKTLSDIWEEEKKGVISGEDELEKIVATVIKENPDALKDFKKGKTASVQFLVGMVMKKTKGRTDPEKVNELILQSLKKL